MKINTAGPGVPLKTHIRKVLFDFAFPNGNLVVTPTCLGLSCACSIRDFALQTQGVMIGQMAKLENYTMAIFRVCAFVIFLRWPELCNHTELRPK